MNLSIIIPIGPGETAGANLIGDLAGLGVEHELIVSSTAANSCPVLPARCVHLTGPVGRALQLNAGAAMAGGDWLCFLHADSRLPLSALKALDSLTRGPDALRYFDLRFASDGPWLMHVNEVGAWVRSRWLGLPFGDQGLCLPRAWFARLGGFNESLDSGEDHALVWAARRKGLPLRPLRAPIFTSARKYAERGWLRTTLRHLHLTGLQARTFARHPHS